MNIHIVAEANWCVGIKKKIDVVIPIQILL